MRFSTTLVLKENFKTYVANFIENANNQINKIIAQEIALAFEELEAF